MTDLAIARAFHVLGVVVWIGGVAAVTLILFPALRRGAFGPQGSQVFSEFERRFVWYARASTIVVALTGFYMVDGLAAWDRFGSVSFWWMHAMVCVWLIFTVLLFVVEPTVRRWRSHKRSSEMSADSFALMHWVHRVLLLLSAITILGAVLGSRGVDFPM